MHSQHLIIVGLLLATAVVIAAAVAWRLRTTTFSSGYDAGYEDAAKGHGLRISDLQAQVCAQQDDIASLNRLRQALVDTQRLETDSIIQDADARIAIFARRAAACTEADLTTLTATANQLELARTTYERIQATDCARFARKMQLQILNLAERLRAALEQPAGNHPDTDLIEWLDKYAIHQCNTFTGLIRFPINSNPEGYPHLRALLRDAQAQQIEADASEQGFGLVQEEAAA